MKNLNTAILIATFPTVVSILFYELKKTMKMKIRLFLFSVIVALAIFLPKANAQLQVNGKFLKDACGETIILKGVNDMNYYDTNWGLAHFREIAQTGANTVRIQIATNTTAAQLIPLLDSCLANKMIPILEFQTYTGKGGNPVFYGGSYDSDSTVLANASAYWTQSSIANLLQSATYKDYLIINLANEPNGAWAIGQENLWGGFYAAQAAADRLNYFNANKTAITTLRNAGYTCPIMIDGPNWGKDVYFFTKPNTNYGQLLLNHDPLQNLIFSIHTYWPTNSAYTDAVSDAEITNRMNALANANLPFVLGEIASANVPNNYTSEPINYSLIMNLAAANNIGYICWWWGDENNFNLLSMTNSGTYATLTNANKGLDIAVNHPYSIQNTSVRPLGLVTGGNCSPLPIILTSFEAKPDNCSTTISWKIGSEKNLNHFEIERSGNAINFKQIATLYDERSSQQYLYTDTNTQKGTNYYRLKIVDNDSSVTYSHIIPVLISCPTPDISIYPNPTEGIVYINGLQGGEQIEVYNVLGEVQQTLRGNSEKVILNFGNLPKALYYILISDKNGSQTNFVLDVRR